MRINTAIAGYGNWGKLYSKYFRRHQLHLQTVIDPMVQHDIPNLFNRKSNTDFINDVSLINWPNIEAGFIVTPVSSHFNVAYDFLENGKHTYIEKPTVETDNELMQLHRLATKNKKICLASVGILSRPFFSQIQTDEIFEQLIVTRSMNFERSSFFNNGKLLKKQFIDAVLYHYLLVVSKYFPDTINEVDFFLHANCIRICTPDKKINIEISNSNKIIHSIKLIGNKDYVCVNNKIFQGGKLQKSTFYQYLDPLGINSEVALFSRCIRRPEEYVTLMTDRLKLNKLVLKACNDFK